MGDRGCRMAAFIRSVAALAPGRAAPLRRRFASWPWRPGCLFVCLFVRPFDLLFVVLLVCLLVCLFVCLFVVLLGVDPCLFGSLTASFGHAQKFPPANPKHRVSVADCLRHEAGLWRLDKPFSVRFAYATAAPARPADVCVYVSARPPI